MRPPAPALPGCYKHPNTPAGVICQRCDKPICPQCMHQASVGFHCPDCARKGAQKVVRGAGGFAVKPVVTYVLIAINIAVFLLGAAVDGFGNALRGDTGQFHFDLALAAKGVAQTGPLQFEKVGVGWGQVYRLVTSGFLHFGVFHLLVNMYALWMLGRAVEAMAGRLRYGVIYTVGLLGGSLGALLLDPNSLTAGASGAIFGLMGAIFMAQRAQGIPFRDSPLLGVLVLNLVITFGISSISVGGHVGGLVGGGLASWLIFDLGRKPGTDKRLPLALCGAAMVACVVVSYVFASGYKG